MAFFQPPYRTATIEAGQAVQGELTLPGEMHGYSFAGRAGDRVTVFVDNRTNAGSRYVSLVLLGPDGSELAKHESGYAQDSVLEGHALPADGEYTLLVDGVGDAVGPYTLTVSRETLP